MKRGYKVVDVFTNRPLLGNPLAVILDCDGLDTTAMQAIARWTNLSETTFLLPPDAAEADYRLRIFTPRNELPFAGHPTLGSAYAALQAGRVSLREGRLVQQCGVGLVSVRVDGKGLDQTFTLTLPPATMTSLVSSDVDELEAIVGQPLAREAAPARVDVGPVWIIARLASVENLLAAKPDLGRLARFETRLRATGITLFADQDRKEGSIEVRSFAPSAGVDEDPVCGSGNGSVAVFRRDRKLLRAGITHYLATQGRCVGRDGQVHVNVTADGVITVGGGCVTCVDGALFC